MHEALQVLIVSISRKRGALRVNSRILLIWERYKRCLSELTNTVKGELSKNKILDFVGNSMLSFTSIWEKALC